MAKLWRDKKITKASKAILIYPKIGFEERSHVMMIKDEAFEFEVDRAFI